MNPRLHHFMLFHYLFTWWYMQLVLLQTDLQDRKSEWRKSQIQRLIYLNKRNSSFRPVYGGDLHQSLDVWYKGFHHNPATFSANSAVNCYNASDAIENQNFPFIYNNSTNYLRQMILNRVQRFEQLKEILERYVVLIVLFKYYFYFGNDWTPLPPQAQR